MIMPNSFPNKIILLQLILCCLCLQIYSQQPANEATPVVRENFVFKSSGLTFPNWKKKPEAVLRFSLENSQQKNFNQLKGSEIKVFLDGNPITLTNDALTLTESNPASLYILLDGSLSMLGDINQFRLNCRNEEGEDIVSSSSKTQGLDKLAAAKSALISFINKLRKDDLVGVYAFDSGLYEVIAKTVDKDAVKRKINNFKPRCEDTSNSTEMYASIENLLIKSGEEKIQTIIVVSDGMQDTDESKKYLTTGFSEYKSRKEKSILQKIANSSTRIYTIPIGDENSLPKDPTNLSYVDKETLCRIGDVGTGGYCEYIDLPDLKEKSETDNVSYQSVLEDSLKSTLEKIRGSFRFGYELRVPMDKQSLKADGETHKLNFEFPVGNIILPYEHVFRIPKPSADNPEPIPQPGPGTVGEPKLITFSTAIQPPSLLGIYLSVAGALSFLGIIPSLFGLLRKRKNQKIEENLLDSLIMVVDEKSPYKGTFCPNKHKTGIQVGEVIILCPNCKKPHHLGCWELNNFRCYDKFHCPERLIIPQNVLEKYGVE